MTQRHFTRLASAAAISLALAGVGCNGGGSMAGNHGRVRFVLSSDPGPTANIVADEATLSEGSDHASAWAFQTATVTLSSILLRTTDGVLLPLDAPLPVDVDVARIDGGRQVVLPDGLLPAGTYDQAVIVMTAVHGMTGDGTTVTIDPPGGGWTAVIPICPLEVTDGSIATVGITLNARNSFLRVEGGWSFQPRFRARLDCAAP